MPNTINSILKSKKQLTHDVWLLTFRLIDPPKITFIPGQYVILVFQDTSGKTCQRLYSIASGTGDSGEFDLLVQLVPNGLASAYFMSLVPENRVAFRGPIGIFFLRPSVRNKVFLITGSGIAPIISMLKSYDFRSSIPSLHLFWGIPTQKDAYLLDFFTSLSQLYPNFEFRVCLSREQSSFFTNKDVPSLFAKGHVDEIFSDWLESKKGRQKTENFDFYLCGGRVVVESLRQYVLASGTAQNHVFYEKY